MTSAVDWALKTNFMSIYLSLASDSSETIKVIIIMWHGDLVGFGLVVHWPQSLEKWLFPPE